MRYLILLLTLTACQTARPPAPHGPLPTERQLDWHRMELNAFIHFTTNTFTGKEWGYGDESPSVFNPPAVETDQWVRILKSAGFKGVILTAKHHDGFTLWPSQHTDHSVEGSPWKGGKGDVVRDLAESCRRHGLKLGIYLSPWDRNRGDYGSPAYIAYYRAQLKELFTNYGPVFEMWFDGANGGDGYYGGAREARRINGATYYDWPATLQLVRGMQPQVIFFSDAGPDIRWVGNERGVAGETNWNTITPDTLFAGKAGIEGLLNTGAEGGSRWIPAEVDVSIRKGWFYHPEEDSLVKSPQRLFDIYLTSVGRGSTLLLNVPPSREGRIHPIDSASLTGFKTLLDSVFAHDLARDATIIATPSRGRRYSTRQLTDGREGTYWAAPDSVHSATIEVHFNDVRTVNYLLLQEHIPLGQRVRRFNVTAIVDGSWKTVASGTTIGYKRILPLDGIRTSRLHITIEESRAAPVLSRISIY